VYHSPRINVGVSKIPAEGGAAVKVRNERLRNPIGSDGKTLYLVVERALVDGLPDFEIRAATPEDGPSRLLAQISPSRVPTWQILNPTLSPDGKWIAQPLTDGFSTNVWALSTETGKWRQLTDFGGRPTFIVRRVSWSADGRFVLAAVAEGDADIASGWAAEG
jgi:WD40 repeat protein